MAYTYWIDRMISMLIQLFTCSERASEREKDSAQAARDCICRRRSVKKGELKRDNSIEWASSMIWFMCTHVLSHSRKPVDANSNVRHWLKIQPMDADAKCGSTNKPTSGALLEMKIYCIDVMELNRKKQIREFRLWKKNKLLQSKAFFIRFNFKLQFNLFSFSSNPSVCVCVCMLMSIVLK